MREISIRALRSNIRQELESLPIAITVRGKVLAVMCTPDEHNSPKCTHRSVKCTPKRGYVCTPEDKEPAMCTPEAHDSNKWTVKAIDNKPFRAQTHHRGRA